jgi:hypothetical protein
VSGEGDLQKRAIPSLLTLLRHSAFPLLLYRLYLRFHSDSVRSKCVSLHGGARFLECGRETGRVLLVHPCHWYVSLGTAFGVGIAWMPNYHLSYSVPSQNLTSL